MDDALLAYALLWGASATYLLFASIHFGTGFYDLLSFRQVGGERVRRAIHNYVNPRWEVTNLLLLLIVVAAATLFPSAVGILGTALVVPESLLVILFIVRGAFLVFEHYGRESRLFAIVHASAGLLILPMFSVILTLIIDSPVNPAGGLPAFDVLSPLAHPITYVTALLVVAGQILLSGALLLHFDTNPEDHELFRFPIFASAISVVILGLIELSQLRSSAAYAYVAMVRLTPVLVVTGGLFGIAVYLIWRDLRRHLEHAFALVVAVDVLALLTFAYAHYPFLVYPDVTAAGALGNPEVRSVLLLALLAAVLVAAPSLAYLNLSFRPRPTS